MAVKATTTTSVVQVTLMDTMGYTKTFSLDNPTENLTLNQIKEAFKPALEGQWLLSNNDTPFISIKQANYQQAIKTSIEGEIVTVSPSSLTFTFSSSASGGSQQGSYQTVVVSGTNEITAASIVNISAPEFDEYAYFVINIEDNNIKVGLFKAGGVGTVTLNATGNLRIVIGTQIINIPVTINNVS